jgi:predicted molibdopterin-dependent oxidoreductase YjgC
MKIRFVRLRESKRRIISIEVDGVDCSALEGDTVLVAVLTNVAALRQSEFDDGARSGFCLMGACQDCWMWTSDGKRLRACTTTVSNGVRVLTRPPRGDQWPMPA